MLNISYKTNINDEWIIVNSFDEIPNNAIEIDCSHNQLLSLPEWKHFTNLQIIDCSYNQLISLPEWKYLTNLQIIECSYNQLISLPEWQHLTNLQTIGCSYNQLTSLPEWQHLTNLQIIDCHKNRLTSLPEWQHLTNLQQIHCRSNQLTSLPEWQHLTNLQKIYCSFNQLASLPEWQHLTNLQTINCYNNRLTSLPGWRHLADLRIIYCSYNKLTSLPVGWVRLRNLIYIEYFGNPIEYIPPNLRRIIQGQRTGQNIYMDPQSVHNHNIQLSLQKSIEYLIKDKPDISISQMEIEITNECIVHELLLDYCNDKTIHNILNVTFEEILNSIWSKIRVSEYKDEIIKILNIEMLDAECMCFTGRLTRLVNCLNGFDDNIKIEIDNNEQMSNISKILYNKYDNIEDYKRELRKEFEERGYSEEDIQIWSNIE
jgi:Leucine-rich repeat (LRR) protein